MSDIWSGLGVGIQESEGEWLYRVGGEVRGPMPQKALVNKLLQGEIGLDTQVAREGSEFHALAQVAAFSEHLKAAQALHLKRMRARRRRVLLVVAVPLLLALTAGGFVAFREFESMRAAQRRSERAAAAEAKKQARALAAVPKMDLVALVSLGTEEDVKFRPTRRRAPPRGRRRAGKGDGGADADESFVSQCKLSQGQIFATLRQHLGKLNVCVQDEKGRDTQGLLPNTLPLEFVVLPSGAVTDLAIGDRHFRRGPLNNCMTKAFRTIKFPASNGANCPVTIPIKIGG